MDWAVARCGSVDAQQRENERKENNIQAKQQRTVQ